MVTVTVWTPIVAELPVKTEKTPATESILSSVADRAVTQAAGELGIVYVMLPHRPGIPCATLMKSVTAGAVY